MLHFAMSAKCVASLRQSLQKVEPDSTLCNASYMTLLITLCDFMVDKAYITPCHLLVTKLQDKLYSVTAP